MIRKSKSAVLVGFLILTVQAARADERLKLSEHLQSLKIAGDFRLRHESFNKKTPGMVDQHRQRFRLRLGLDAGLPHNLTLKTKFASGAGEQQSTNQSLDNLSSQKQFWIDQAYLHWAPLSGFQAAAGRQKNPFWRIYSNDAVWDDDFNPEGMSQSAEFLLPMGARFFANALQMAADEDSGTGRDQWMFGEQAGFDFLIGDIRLKLAGAYYDWIYERESSFSANKANEGNRRSGSTLLNEFGVFEGTGELSTNVAGLPVSFQGTTVKNTRALDTLLPKEDKGYQAGIILGKAKTACSWELAYFNKYLKTDAVVADVADSDFGDGGTNRKGHIGWAAYNPENWLQVKAKYFVTRVINEDLAPGADDINRLQVDLSVKF